MFRDTHVGPSSPTSELYQFDGPRVGKRVDRDCDAAPDSRPGVIAFRCSIPRHAGSYSFWPRRRSD
jgi:hypothetical protein